jgi:hypothetical protein
MCGSNGAHSANAAVRVPAVAVHDAIAGAGASVVDGIPANFAALGTVGIRSSIDARALIATGIPARVSVRRSVAIRIAAAPAVPIFMRSGAASPATAIVSGESSRYQIEPVAGHDGVRLRAVVRPAADVLTANQTAYQKR